MPKNNISYKSYIIIIMGRGNFLIFLAFLFIILDIYTYYGLKTTLGQGRFSRIYTIVYSILSIATYISIFQLTNVINQGAFGVRSLGFNLMTGFIFTMFVTKLIFTAFMGIQDIIRYIIGAGRYISHFFVSEMDKTAYVPARRQFINTAITVVASIPFFTMIYGTTRGKYNYKVEKITLTYDDLPSEFDGFRIVQISDIHAGSFDSIDSVAEGIQMINDLQPDLFCFTGDLVNAEKEEIDPYIDIFEKIRAKFGKFAVLGNHDYYGQYNRDDSNAEKVYFDDFFQRYTKMGLHLLNNESASIEKNGQKIDLVGVENWGAGRWFPKKGDLVKATNGLEKDAFAILLSHDPTHWDEKVLDFEKKMHLTLSGHTHGFQFGVKIPGFKWSPAQYRYKRWMGLYTENDKNLYINRGFGFLGFPGRVGMWPEITEITLRKGIG